MKSYNIFKLFLDQVVWPEFPFCDRTFAATNKKDYKMEGQYRKDIYPGLEVGIILKKDQRIGKLTYGVVKDLLTSAAYHLRGIKVRLEDGQVGRVAAIEPLLED